MLASMTPVIAAADASAAFCAGAGFPQQPCKCCSGNKDRYEVLCYTFRRLLGWAVAGSTTAARASGARAFFRIVNAAGCISGWLRAI
jgi:hypothetical protein